MSDNLLIKVSEMQDQEDGSAIFQVETSPEVTQMLIEVGLTTLVKKAIAEELPHIGNIIPDLQEK